jgi:hypothetical protein
MNTQERAHFEYVRDMDLRDEIDIERIKVYLPRIRKYAPDVDFFAMALEENKGRFWRNHEAVRDMLRTTHWHEAMKTVYCKSVHYYNYALEKGIWIVQRRTYDEYDDARVEFWNRIETPDK